MHKKQSGAILVVSLVILFALTLLVLSGSQTVIVQEKMTAAVRDMRVSLEIAESGIRDAEKYIETLNNLTAFNDLGGLYSEGNGPTDLFADATWDDDDYFKSAATSVSGQEAQYFIEYMGLASVSKASSSVSITGYGETVEESEVSLFKVVSRALGSSGNTERIVVTYYAKSF